LLLSVHRISQKLQSDLKNITWKVQLGPIMNRLNVGSKIIFYLSTIEDKTFSTYRNAWHWQRYALFECDHLVYAMLLQCFSVQW